MKKIKVAINKFNLTHYRASTCLFPHIALIAHHTTVSYTTTVKINAKMYAIGVWTWFWKTYSFSVDHERCRGENGSALLWLFKESLKKMECKCYFIFMSHTVLIISEKIIDFQ